MLQRNIGRGPFPRGRNAYSSRTELPELGLMGNVSGCRVRLRTTFHNTRCTPQPLLEALSLWWIASGLGSNTSISVRPTTIIADLAYMGKNKVVYFGHNHMIFEYCGRKLPRRCGHA
jgi:hypothetical protein